MIKILIIDDEEIIRISCERALQVSGFATGVAAGGREGIEMLEKEKYDVVLLDLKMPDIDGMEVLHRIKTSWPDVKVIMISGYSTVDTAVNALRQGAVNFIQKPFSPDTIISAINEVTGDSNGPG
jgi:DNA-binding NtrC family response regulator